MDHWKILLTVINSLAGAAVIAVLFGGKRKFKGRCYSRPVAMHTVFYNILLWTAVFDKYLKLNLPAASGILERREYSYAGSIIFLAVTAGMFLSMFSIRISLTGKEASRENYLRATAAGITVLLAVAGFPADGETDPVTAFIIETACDIFFIAEAILTVLIIRDAGKLKAAGDQHCRTVLSFGILYFSRYLLIGVLLALPEFRFGLSLLALAWFNLIPLFWFLRYTGSQSPDKTLRMERMFREYGISKREAEVIKLLLEGRSNSEIEDTLCISPHTVKNHIYNIFRKLNISGRYQLISMFSAD